MDRLCCYMMKGTCYSVYFHTCLTQMLQRLVLSIDIYIEQKLVSVKFTNFMTHYIFNLFLL